MCSPGNLLCPENALWAAIIFSFWRFLVLQVNEIPEVRGFGEILRFRFVLVPWGVVLFSLSLLPADFTLTPRKHLDSPAFGSQLFIFLKSFLDSDQSLKCSLFRHLRSKRFCSLLKVFGILVSTWGKHLGSGVPWDKVYKNITQSSNTICLDIKHDSQELREHQRKDDLLIK